MEELPKLNLESKLINCYYSKKADYNYCALCSRQCYYQSDYPIPYVNKGQVGGRMYICNNYER